MMFTFMFMFAISRVWPHTQINSAGSKKFLLEMFAVSQYPPTLKKKSIKNIQQVEVYQIEFSD